MSLNSSGQLVANLLDSQSRSYTSWILDPGLAKFHDPVRYDFNDWISPAQPMPQLHEIVFDESGRNVLGVFKNDSIIQVFLAEELRRD